VVVRTAEQRLDPPLHLHRRRGGRYEPKGDAQYRTQQAITDQNRQHPPADAPQHTASPRTATRPERHLYAPRQHVLSAASTSAAEPAQATTLRSSRMTNVLPCPASLSTQISPPIARARSRLIARPSPTPSRGRFNRRSTCVKGSKIARCFTAGIPGPS